MVTFMVNVAPTVPSRNRSHHIPVPFTIHHHLFPLSVLLPQWAARLCLQSHLRVSSWTIASSRPLPGKIPIDHLLVSDAASGRERQRPAYCCHGHDFRPMRGYPNDWHGPALFRVGRAECFTRLPISTELSVCRTFLVGGL